MPLLAKEVVFITASVTSLKLCNVRVTIKPSTSKSFSKWPSQVLTCFPPEINFKDLCHLFVQVASWLVSK